MCAVVSVCNVGLCMELVGVYNVYNYVGWCVMLVCVRVMLVCVRVMVVCVMLVGACVLVGVCACVLVDDVCVCVCNVS